MSYMYYFTFLLLLFLPTFIANAMPVMMKNMPIISSYNKPMNEKMFWKNKTYSGFIFWVLFWMMMSILQYKLLHYIWVEYIINEYYNIVSNMYMAIFMWFMQWFWALLWDLIESFFKSKMWKKPWEMWIFWDWVDYMLLSIMLFSFMYIPSMMWMMFLMLFAPLMSLFSNMMAYWLWWKNVWY